MFKKSLVILSLSFGISVAAQDIAEMLNGVQVDKSQIMNMIDTMYKSGTITHEQATQAKSRLRQMNNSELDSIKRQAVEQVTSGQTLEEMNRALKSGQMKQKSPAKVVKSKNQAQAKPNNIETMGRAPASVLPIDLGKKEEMPKEPTEKDLVDALNYLNNR